VGLANQRSVQVGERRCERDDDIPNYGGDATI